MAAESSQSKQPPPPAAQPTLPSHLCLCRFLVFLRLLVMLAFFGWRVINPNEDAFGLWVTSVICEIWIGLAWLVDQGPRLAPVNRETFLDRLTLKSAPPPHSICLLLPVHIACELVLETAVIASCF
jgi:hypothetical protein